MNVYLQIVAFCWVTATREVLCSHNDVEFLGPDGFYYYLIEQDVSWYNAERICGDENARLAVFHSDAAWLQNKLPITNYELWVGAKKTFTSNGWKWIDGKSINSRYWRSGEPKPYLYDGCVKLQFRPNDGYLIATSCYDKKLPFICQRRVEVEDRNIGTAVYNAIGGAFIVLITVVYYCVKRRQRQLQMQRENSQNTGTVLQVHEEPAVPLGEAPPPMVYPSYPPPPPYVPPPPGYNEAVNQNVPIPYPITQTVQVNESSVLPPPLYPPPPLHQVNQGFPPQHVVK